MWEFIAELRSVVHDELELILIPVLTLFGVSEDAQYVLLDSIVAVSPVALLGILFALVKVWLSSSAAKQTAFLVVVLVASLFLTQISVMFGFISVSAIIILFRFFQSLIVAVVVGFEIGGIFTGILPSVAAAWFIENFFVHTTTRTMRQVFNRLPRRYRVLEFFLVVTPTVALLTFVWRRLSELTPVAIGSAAQDPSAGFDVTAAVLLSILPSLYFYTIYRMGESFIQYDFLEDISANISGRVLTTFFRR